MLQNHANSIYLTCTSLYENVQGNSGTDKIHWSCRRQDKSQAPALSPQTPSWSEKEPQQIVVGFSVTFRQQLFQMNFRLYLEEQLSRKHMLSTVVNYLHALIWRAPGSRFIFFFFFFLLLLSSEIQDLFLLCWAGEEASKKPSHKPKCTFPLHCIPLYAASSQLHSLQRSHIPAVSTILTITFDHRRSTACKSHHAWKQSTKAIFRHDHPAEVTSSRTLKHQRASQVYDLGKRDDIEKKKSLFSY